MIEVYGVKVDLPIKFHCKECGYEERYTSIPIHRAYPCKCPRCEHESVRPGFRRLPCHSFSYDEKPQRYSIGSNDEPEWQYYFRAYNGKSIGRAFSIDPESWGAHNYTDNPLVALAELIKQINRKYIYCGSVKDLDDFRINLESDTKESTANILINRRESLYLKIAEALSELSACLQEDEEGAD